MDIRDDQTGFFFNLICQVKEKYSALSFVEIIKASNNNKLGMSRNNCEGLGWLQPCFTWHKIAFLCLKQHRHWTESHDWEKGINKCLQFIFASMRQLDECYHSPVTSDNISACSRILENDEEGDFKRVWQRVIALSHSLLLSIRITPLIRKSAASFYITHVGEKKKYWSTISYVFVPWNALFVKNSSLGKRPANH